MLLYTLQDDYMSFTAHISYVSFHFDRHPDLSALGYKNDIKKRMYKSY